MTVLQQTDLSSLATQALSHTPVEGKLGEDGLGVVNGSRESVDLLRNLPHPLHNSSKQLLLMNPPPAAQISQSSSKLVKYIQNENNQSMDQVS